MKASIERAFTARVPGSFQVTAVEGASQESLTDAVAWQKSQGFGGFPGADGGRAPVVTGPDGRFAIYTPREGDVIVDATKKGLPTAKSSTFRVAAGERKSGITLTIPRGR